MKYMRKITIKDLAEELNISAMTVSRALRNAPDVSDETKKAVVELARLRNYHPNALATSLSTKKSNTIGVLIPIISRHFFSKVLDGIEEYANHEKFKMIICQTNDRYEKEKADLETLLTSRVDGIIAAVSKDTQHMNHYKEIQNLGVPIVLFDRVSDDFTSTKVVSDDYDGACKIVEHLFEIGCRKIAHITCFPELLISRQRSQAYCDTLRKHGLQVDENMIVVSDLSVNAGKEAATKLFQLESPPDGIFAMVDMIGIGAILAAKEKGLQVPKDVAIAGFGNEDVSSWIEPSLTTVDQFPYLMGKKASEMIINQIHTVNFLPSVKEVVIPTSLIFRNSTSRH